jgi:prepilin-type N-terminal cleavage/methylation domain-containing protein
VLATAPLDTEFRLTHHRQHQHRRFGFTFVELLVAMMVFGALSAVAVPRYRQVRERAYTGAMRSDLAGLRIAQEAFWAENQAYTTDTTQLDWRPTSGVLLSIAAPDPVAGYDATAVHVEVRGLVCTTSVGRVTATGAPSGEISCGPGTSVATGAGTPATPSFF